MCPKPLWIFFLLSFLILLWVISFGRQYFDPDGRQLCERRLQILRESPHFCPYGFGCSYLLEYRGNTDRMNCPAIYAFGKLFQGLQRNRREDQRALHFILKIASLGLLLFLLLSPLLTGRAFERDSPPPFYPLPHPSFFPLYLWRQFIWMARFFWARISEIQEITIERLLYACCHHHLSMKDNQRVQWRKQRPGPARTFKEPEVIETELTIHRSQKP